MFHGESSLLQHKLLVGVFQLSESGCRSKSEVFVSKRKVWKLKEPEIRQTFEAKVGERLANRPDGEVDGDWGCQSSVGQFKKVFAGCGRGGMRKV